MTACQTHGAWQAMPTRSRPDVVRYPMPIRVTLASGALIVLDSARVANDSLYGYRRGERRGVVDSTAPIALRQVMRLEDRTRLNADDTLIRGLSVAGMVSVVGLVVLLLVGLPSSGRD
jgi:hypothetical protein